MGLGNGFWAGEKKERRLPRGRQDHHRIRKKGTRRADAELRVTGGQGVKGIGKFSVRGCKVKILMVGKKGEEVGKGEASQIGGEEWVQGGWRLVPTNFGPLSTRSLGLKGTEMITKKKPLGGTHKPEKMPKNGKESGEKIGCMFLLRKILALGGGGEGTHFQAVVLRERNGVPVRFWRRTAQGGGKGGGWGVGFPGGNPGVW